MPWGENICLLSLLLRFGDSRETKTGLRCRRFCLTFVLGVKFHFRRLTCSRRQRSYETDVFVFVNEGRATGSLTCTVVKRTPASWHKSRVNQNRFGRILFVSSIRALRHLFCCTSIVSTGASATHCCAFQTSNCCLTVKHSEAINTDTERLCY